MTPLAQTFINDWCNPIAKRRVYDPHELCPILIEAKCFEATLLSDLLLQMEGEYVDSILTSERVFLPAPVTFLERRTPSGGRDGVLLQQVGDGIVAMIYANSPSAHESDAIPSMRYFGKIDNGTLLPIDHNTFRDCPIAQSDINGRLVWAICTLFLVNTPGIVGKKTHQPHAGLQRKIAKASGLVGKFPLRAWTEIKIFCDSEDVTPIDSEETIESRLSGRKCLHFVRAFWRTRNGVREKVECHWRGDPSLGMRRSRYIAEPKPSLGAAH